LARSIRTKPDIFLQLGKFDRQYRSLASLNSGVTSLVFQQFEQFAVWVTEESQPSGNMSSFTRVYLPASASWKLKT
jgi:hypothetical protein